jgi:hypothetical protein
MMIQMKSGRAIVRLDGNVLEYEEVDATSLEKNQV